MMNKLLYIYSKFIKKVIRGKAILRSSIAPTACINSGCHIVDSKIGKFSYCGYDCEIINCEIGNLCSLADHIFIGGNEHPTSWVSTSPVFHCKKHASLKKSFYAPHSTGNSISTKKTIIGHDVWIGHGATIKQGVKIGTGACIGAGAVVTKDVAPYAIVGGVPANVIKYRFQKEIIDKLLKSKWWELDDDSLQNLSQYMYNPELFLSNIKKI